MKIGRRVKEKIQISLKNVNEGRYRYFGILVVNERFNFC